MPVSDSCSSQLVKEVNPSDGVESPAGSSAATISGGRTDYEEVESNMGIESPWKSRLVTDSQPSEVAGGALLGSSTSAPSLSLKGEAEDASVTSRASTRTPSPELDPRDTDLSVLQFAGNLNPLPPGTFTEGLRICEGIHGDVFLCEKHDGKRVEHVAVKKFRRTTLQPRCRAKRNERLVFMKGCQDLRSSEDASTAIGVHTYLAEQQDAPQYLLQMLGIFSDGPHVWLVTEFAEGGELLEVAKATTVTEAQVQRYMAQLLLAVAYLHRHHIGHRDISLENILLKGNTVKLMDFGQAVRSHSEAGEPLRFFLPCGKPYYVAPECHVYKSETVRVMTPLNAAAGEVWSLPVPAGYPCLVNEVRLPGTAAPGELCRADAWGYTAQPADVFSVGLCCFILAYGAPPWEMAVLWDARFREVYTNGVDLPSVEQARGRSLLSAEAMDFVASTTEIQARRRLTAEQCLATPWLAEAVRVADINRGH